MAKKRKEGWKKGIKGKILLTAAPRDKARRKIITKISAKKRSYRAYYQGKAVGTFKTKKNAIKRLREY